MKWIKVLMVLAVSAGLFFAVACGDDDSPTGSSATAQEKPGANTPITQANGAQVWATAFPTILGALDVGEGTTGGMYEEDGGDATVSVNGTTTTVVYDNYSDDGEIWISGTITIQVSQTGSFTYTGNLSIRGTYSGDLQIDLSGDITGLSGTITTNGTTITIPAAG